MRLNAPRSSLTIVSHVTAMMPPYLLSEYFSALSPKLMYLYSPPSLTCCSAVRPESCRSEEHTSELQSLMRISYAVFCLKKKKNRNRACKNELEGYNTKK